MESNLSMPRLNTASTFEDTQTYSEVEENTETKQNGEGTEKGRTEKSGKTGESLETTESRTSGGKSVSEGVSEIQVNYKTGATFIGLVQNNKKVGKGIFTWPDGSKYDGTFVENRRHGKGEQIWPDGSVYNGDFVDDLRHGTGYILWANGESYEGSFFKDRRHGPGRYTWPDGSTYDGRFFMDRKEGYGVFKFANGDKFEGLYIENEREGPGVMTYSNDTQDVGLWYGEKLIKICTLIEHTFTLSQHKEFQFNPREHTVYIEFEEERKKEEKPESDDLESIDNLDIRSKAERYCEDLDPQSLAVNREIFEEAFFGNSEEKDLDTKEEGRIAAWNKTPLLIQIQKSVYKHRARTSEVSFDVDSVIRGDRSSFSEKGPLESASESYLMLAMTGDATKVHCLLTCGNVHPDVADQSGHTALIGATVNWHMDIINLILNHGGDVNKVNNEGSSALSAGIIFFFPSDCFRFNIAEQYLKRNKNRRKVMKEGDHPKGILTNKQPYSQERRESLLNMAKQQSENTQIVSVDSLDSGVRNVEGYITEPSQLTIKESEFERQKEELDVLSDREQQDSAIDSDVEKDIDDDLMNQMPEDFESNKRVYDYKIQVPDHLLERCATQLSTNERVVSQHSNKNGAGLGTARLLAIQMSIQEQMKKTLDLLLRRGADPNASSVPMPVLFFAIKAADVEMVKTLLVKGASTNTRLPKEQGGLTPLHIACAVPGDEGVQMTKLLLDALADPDARAEQDKSFLNRTLEEEWSKDVIPEESLALLGGRTPLQIACSRDDNYKQASQIVHLLLEHKANPDLLCNGFSALALAIASGNDLAIEELLLYDADPSLKLTHGVGTALCAATNTEYEHRRNINQRLQLIDRLIRAGADILAFVPIGIKRVLGTAVDYAYYMFNQDRRIAHMPYHALTHSERDTYNARRKLLEHVGAILRMKAVARERKRLQEESLLGRRSASPSSEFVYIGAGAPVPPGKSRSKQTMKSSQVTFDSVSETKSTSDSDIRKPLFKYCYECGRSIFVRLSPCTRCKEVYYCSKTCKLKAWNTRHKDECIRVGGRSKSPSPARGNSPTPTTTFDKDRKITVGDLNKKDKRNLVPIHGLSKSAPPTRAGGEQTRRGGEYTRGGGEPSKEWVPPGFHGIIDNYSFV